MLLDADVVLIVLLGLILLLTEMLWREGLALCWVGWRPLREVPLEGEPGEWLNFLSLFLWGGLGGRAIA